jgi:hypothetical protein
MFADQFDSVGDLMFGALSQFREESLCTAEE